MEEGRVKMIGTPTTPDAERQRRIREIVNFIEPLIMGDRDKAKASAVTIVIAMAKGLVPHVRMELDR
jgi:hypothetical protein